MVLTGGEGKISRVKQFGKWDVTVENVLFFLKEGWWYKVGKWRSIVLDKANLSLLSDKCRRQVESQGLNTAAWAGDTDLKSSIF